MGNKRIGQKRALNRMKREYGLKRTSPTVKVFVDNVATVDNDIIDKINAVYLGTSSKKVSSKGLIDDKVWTTDLDEAIKNAKEYDKHGVGGIVVVKKMKGDPKTDCFTVIPDEIPFLEVASQQANTDSPLSIEQIKSQYGDDKKRSKHVYFMTAKHDQDKCLLYDDDFLTIDIRKKDKKFKTKEEITDEISDFVVSFEKSEKEINV